MVDKIDDWTGAQPAALVLRRARDEACNAFVTVLSPDYNAAHANHLHLDQAERMIGSYCR